MLSELVAQIYLNMKNKIELLMGDITQQKVDAIVNAANTTLLGGGGVDGAIHRAAGPTLLEECRTLHGCEIGGAKITKGYNLNAKWVIHTVGPVWQEGRHNETKLLAQCYKNSLSLAEHYKIKSIAFPAISTGAYRFPIELAAHIAWSEIKNFLEKKYSFPEKIIIVCFNKEIYDVYRKLYLGGL